MNVSELPAPAPTVAPVVPKLVWPVVPVTVPQFATPLATQVAFALSVTPAGSGSDTVALIAFEGPALVTTTVYVAVPPGVYVALPSVLLTASAETGVSVSVSLAVLLAGVGSTTVGGTVMVTVLVIVPVAPGAIAAVTVYVAVPALSSETNSLMGPLPLALPHDEPTDAAQVQLVNVTPAGGLSTTFAPATALGPALLATIVYVVLVPGTTLATPSVLVMPRLATPVAASVADAGNGLVTPCADVNAPAGERIDEVAGRVGDDVDLDAAAHVGGDRRIGQRDRRRAGERRERAAARVGRSRRGRDRHARPATCRSERLPSTRSRWRWC